MLAVAALRVLLMGAAGPVEATPDNRLQVLKSKAMLIALDEHADAVPLPTKLSRRLICSSRKF